ncbi:MAG: hypothetical protein KUG81_06335 [Gammaproteobacteria bacterium]|nr:hypothetical protein [Gammaproteobacteria bacterium]
MKKLLTFLLITTCLNVLSQVPVVETYTEARTENAETTLTQNKPTGVVTGDFLLAFIGNDDSSSADEFAAPTGWTKIQENGSGTPDAHVAAFYRVADGTEGATQDFTSDSSDFLWGYYIRMSSVDTDDPIDATETGIEAGSSSTHTIPELTTVADDCLAFFVLGFDGGDGLSFGVSGTGWTKTDEVQAGAVGSGGASGVFGTKSMATAGATVDVVITPDVTDGAAAFQFSIKGSEGGGGASRRIFNIDR